MKRKKIPFIVLIFLAFLGFDVGFIVGGLIFAYNPISWGILILCLFIVFLLLQFFYRGTLEEWGIIEPPKKKEKKKERKKE